MGALVWNTKTTKITKGLSGSDAFVIFVVFVVQCLRFRTPAHTAPPWPLRGLSLPVKGGKGVREFSSRAIPGIALHRAAR